MTTTFDRMWQDLGSVGRDPGTGGYRRYAWTREDASLREWFAGEASARGLELTADRAGNQWAWWGDPDAQPGLVVGSHLDSVPDGGAFDGPLGVVSAFAALDALREEGFQPALPIGVVNFGDEEGARFGIACAGSRMITGALSADRALALRDADGVTMAEAMSSAGRDVTCIGRDEETLGRIGTFIELHVEQGRGLVDLGRPIAVGSGIWPHGRWRVDLPGQANHAGTTRLADRSDPMLALAAVIQRARSAAVERESVATCGKVRIEPNGVNAIASHVSVWLDARGAVPDSVRGVVADIAEIVRQNDGRIAEESWTDRTAFDGDLAAALSQLLDDAPLLDTGAGHDAGVLASDGVATAMLFVRNPTGVSHSPEEFAERDDCLAGVDSLAAVIKDLAR